MPELHAPPGARDTFRRLVGCWGNEDLIESAFELSEYDPAGEVRIGSVGVTFQAVPHYTETYAMCLTSTRGKGVLVYGADSRPTDAPDRLREGRRADPDGGHAAAAGARG